MDEPILKIEGLKKYYPIEKGVLKKLVGHVRAVDDVTLTIQRNETVGLVGESGCGKTTLGRCILRAIEPTAGKITFAFGEGGEIDFTALDKKGLRAARRDIQMIFQNPYSSLNPRMTVFDIIAEPMRLSGIKDQDRIAAQARKLIEMVGLKVAYLDRYPHAFSGGQRQRIGIARSLALSPRFVVADEAVSALDVSVQAQILNLLCDLQDELSLTYLFITHDLSVVEHISDRVCVMYLGRVVELAKTVELFAGPRHPYTEALISAIPSSDPEKEARRVPLLGEVASAASMPEGCAFHPRCGYACERCKTEVPNMEEVSEGHFCACHRAAELSLSGVY